MALQPAREQNDTPNSSTGILVAEEPVNPFKEKCELLYKLYEAHTPPPDTSSLHPSVAARINDLPLNDRREIIENASAHLAQAKNTEGDWKSLLYWLNILRKNYYERTKTYLIPDKINTQAYLHSKLEEEIGAMCKKKNLDVMASRIGWAFLDTNALKGTNDVLGHDKGNLIIRKIARGLKSLVKIKTDRNAKVYVQCAIQSGDEYNLLLKSNMELQPDVDSIFEKIQFYLNTLKTSGILDFSSRTPEEVERIKTHLLEKGINLNDTNNRFIISASCGISTLQEVLEEIQVREDDSYHTVVGKIKTRLETKAENRAMASKQATKDRAAINPLMVYLLSFRK